MKFTSPSHSEATNMPILKHGYNGLVSYLKVSDILLFALLA